VVRVPPPPPRRPKRGLSCLVGDWYQLLVLPLGEGRLPTAVPGGVMAGLLALDASGDDDADNGTTDGSSEINPFGEPPRKT